MNSTRYSLFEVFKKHATGAGRDPFPAGNMAPVPPPPGSIEANRREAVKAQADQEAAASNQQKQELKAQQQALATSNQESEKLQKGYQNLQQQLQATKLQVEAYKARDAMKTPGLSPSLKVTQKRMQDSVKALARTKRAGMNPPTVAPDTKASAGPPVGSQSPGKADVTSLPIKPGGSKTTGFTDNSKLIAPAYPTSTSQVSTADRVAAAKARAASMTPEQKTALKERQARQRMEIKNQIAQNPATNTLGDYVKEIGNEYLRFGADPHAYMRDKGGVLWSDTGLKDLANRNTTEGTIGRSILGGLAAGGDWFKNIFTQPLVSAAAGITQMPASIATTVGETASGLYGAGREIFAKGLDAKASDISNAYNTTRQNFRREAGYDDIYVPSFGTGLKNLALGVGGTALNIYGGPAVGALRKGFLPAVKALAPITAAGMGYDYVNSTYGNAGHAPQSNTPDRGVAPRLNAPTPKGAAPIRTAAADTPTLDPGTAHAINYGGYANPQMFPAAMASQYSIDPNSFIGTIANMGMNLFGQPNPQTFMQGQMPIRNQISPYTQMNNAMTAFGQNYGTNGYPGYM